MSSLASSIYSPNDYIYIICKQTCYIRQLRRSGPISTPLRIKVSVAYSIVISGVKIYQYDPVTKRVALLTIKNVFKKDKFETAAPVNASTFSMSRNVEETEEDKTETPVESVVEQTEETSTVEQKTEPIDETTVPVEESKDEEPEVTKTLVETPVNTDTETNPEVSGTEEESEEEDEEVAETEEAVATPTQNTNTSSGKKKKKKKNNAQQQHVEG